MKIDSKIILYLINGFSFFITFLFFFIYKKFFSEMYTFFTGNDWFIIISTIIKIVLFGILFLIIRIVLFKLVKKYKL
jgi:hypothetical protein